MNKITLDTEISNIPEFKKIFTISSIGTKTSRFLTLEKITSLGELLMYPDEFLFGYSNFGIKSKNVLKDLIHELGFVFIDEPGYIDQLKGYVQDKYHIYDFKLELINDSLRSKLLDFNLRDLLVFFPTKLNKDVFLNPLYSSKKLKEILNLNSLIMRKNRNLDWLNNSQIDNFNIWKDLIYELGFKFANEPGYNEQIKKLERLKETKTDFDFTLLDKNISELNYEKYLSEYTYNYLRSYNIITMGDLLDQDKQFYQTHFPKICLKQIKDLLCSFNLFFKDEELYGEFKLKMKQALETKQKSKDIAEKTKLTQRFSQLSNKVNELIKQATKLEMENKKLTIINDKLEELIAQVSSNNLNLTK